MEELKGFDYIRKANLLLRPRTPMTALRGVEMGLLPPEAFIYKATSIKPLFEEPVDLQEIDRILAKPNIDVDTLLLLMRILNVLIKDEDREVGLFAAESINAIENRYNKKIEKLKESLEEGEEVDLRKELGILYYELAMLHGESKAIKKFYLRESYSHFTKILEEFVTIEVAEYITMVLIELELYDQARQFTNFLHPSIADDPTVKFLKAKIEYYGKNYKDVIRQLYHLTKPDIEKKKFEEEVIDHWMGD
jgi:hypothetical protein